MIRRGACKQGAAFDETFCPAWYEDVDFCHRLKLDNWEVYFAPHLRFPHSGGYSAKTMGGGRFVYAYYRNQVRYAGKWFAWYEVIIIRASVVLGALGRMIARPSHSLGYAKVLFGALIAW
jgi:GT2 family glycosyltransferase